MPFVMHFHVNFVSSFDGLQFLFQSEGSQTSNSKILKISFIHMICLARVLFRMDRSPVV
jgi:hypothetical protein